jgi:molecular chaperone GrpE
MPAWRARQFRIAHPGRTGLPWRSGRGQCYAASDGEAEEAISHRNPPGREAWRLSRLDFSPLSPDMRGKRQTSRNNAMTDASTRPSESAALAGEAAGAPETEEAKIAALVEALSKEVSEHKDRHLRTLAEMENLRRRTDREVADSRVYGVTNFARDILGVADNMARSVTALTAELSARADEGVKALLEGVELTERELLKVLEKHGVKKFEPLGEKFDPNLHQAVFEMPDPTKPAGTVAQVIQPGYMIGERVLRPAMVAVAKGGPKPTAAGPANDNPGAAG